MTKTLLVDIDGTICNQVLDGKYENAKPDKEAIDTINKLYDEGFEIIFFTARYMGRFKGNSEEAAKFGYESILNQLKGWGVKFHKLYMGKPRSDIIIDDRALFFQRDWKKIYEECKNSA